MRFEINKGQVVRAINLLKNKDADFIKHLTNFRMSDIHPEHYPNPAETKIALSLFHKLSDVIRMADDAQLIRWIEESLRFEGFVTPEKVEISALDLKDYKFEPGYKLFQKGVL